MRAIEFQTNIQDGTIQLPDRYRERFNGPVRVIILTDDVAIDSDMVGQLLDRPLQVKQFTPIVRDQIYDRSFTTWN